MNIFFVNFIKIMDYKIVKTTSKLFCVNAELKNILKRVFRLNLIYFALRSCLKLFVRSTLYRILSMAAHAI